MLVFVRRINEQIAIDLMEKLVSTRITPANFEQNKHVRNVISYLKCFQHNFQQHVSSANRM